MSDYTNPDWLCIHSVVNHQCKKCWPNLAAPLPPTAEQTSIARFNALANEIRANQAESLKFYGSFMNVFDVLIHKIDRLAKPNVAVAKKKAAPLVGKKGTGRNG